MPNQGYRHDQWNKAAAIVLNVTDKFLSRGGIEVFREKTKHFQDCCHLNLSGENLGVTRIHENNRSESRDDNGKSPVFPPNQALFVKDEH